MMSDIRILGHVDKDGVPPFQLNGHFGDVNITIQGLRVFASGLLGATFRAGGKEYAIVRTEVQQREPEKWVTLS